jgi:hypothetical protein
LTTFFAAFLTAAFLTDLLAGFLSATSHLRCAGEG